VLAGRKGVVVGIGGVGPRGAYNAAVSVKEHRHAAPRRVSCAILVVSDTRTAESDRSGPVIRSCIEEAGHHVVVHRIVSDDRERIGSSVRMFADDGTIDAVIISGGTGLAPRDVTYEAVSELFSKTIDGFGELFRALSFQQIGAAAMLSRAVGGLISRTVVYALPGSPPACELALRELILPELGHAVSLANPRKWKWKQ
jgi:molybdenum cofactor biosynthesis protein B